MSTIRFDNGGGRQSGRNDRAWAAIDRRNRGGQPDEIRAPEDRVGHRRTCDQTEAQPSPMPTRVGSGGRPPPCASPALHATLDYRARALRAALESAAGAGHPLQTRFAPATAALLRWWCADACVRSRVDNFNHVQRQALLHLLLAHEDLRGDDPARPGPPGHGTGPAGASASGRDTAVYRLRLAPGSGLRWVLQAVLVWRWALAHAEGRSEGLQLDLIAATPTLVARLRQAVAGERDGAGPAATSVLRHARLFLPPEWRAPFGAWLAAAVSGGLLRVRMAAPGEPPPPGPWRLIAAPASGAGRGGPRLQVDLLLAATAAGEATAPSDETAIVEAPLSRAIARGVCKLPVLEHVAAVGALRTHTPRRVGRRPRLSRTQQRLLAGGLAALRQREATFVALDPTRRPRMAVLCATPTLQRAARRWLLGRGVDAASLSAEIDPTVADDETIVLDSLPPRAATSDPRVCVVVALRTRRDGGAALAAAIASSIAATGAALLWPEPDFAELRTENLERIATGRPPAHLLDALGVFDDPGCHGDYAALPHAIARTAALPAADDLFLAPLQQDSTRFDIAVPTNCDDTAPEAGPEAIERLCDLPSRILRRRQALAVTRSTHTHAPCGRHDNGLRRAFLECAEADPAIEAHALPDARRHGIRLREASLAQGCVRGWPDALVRTAQRVYLVEFLPFSPAWTDTGDPQARPLRRWLRRAEAQPATDGGGRRWSRVALPVPMFWSWKRGGYPLTALLAMLADGALPGQDERHASTC